MKLSKLTKNIKSPGWNKVKLSRDIIKTNTLKVIWLRTEAIKVWQTPLKMCCFSILFRLATRQQKKFSFKGSVFNDLSWLIQNHHLFFQLHKCLFDKLFLRQPLSSSGRVQVAFLKLFGYACYVFNQAWVWSDHRIAPMDCSHGKAQQKMAPWYFSMAKVASQT